MPDGIQQALARALDAAGGQDVRIGGGVGTMRQYLAAGRIDEMHLAYSPVLLCAGESLLGGMDLPDPGYEVRGNTLGGAAMHVMITK